MSLNVALVAPEIPQNTGNVMRLCANVGARLHLVEPLGFNLNERGLRRASLDYRDLVDVVVHRSFGDLLKLIDRDRAYVATLDGKTSYHQLGYQDEDTVIFGSESQGLPVEISSALCSDNHIRIPMMPSNRSINLSNAVSLVVYEMWRQLDFAGDKYPLPRSQKYFS